MLLSLEKASRSRCWRLDQWGRWDLQLCVGDGADIACTKPTTDILINGTAYAPNGRPSTNFLIETRIGEMHKVLRVVGQRTGDGPFDDAPSRLNLSSRFRSSTNELMVVTTRPTRSSEAGYRSAQPCGSRRRRQKENRDTTLCPTSSPAWQDRQEWSRGFPERLPVTGRRAWNCAALTTKPGMRGANRSFPTTGIRRSLQCAPGDQQSATYLHGGEEVELVNLTRDGLLRVCSAQAHIRLYHACQRARGGASASCRRCHHRELDFPRRHDGLDDGTSLPNWMLTTSTRDRIRRQCQIHSMPARVRIVATGARTPVGLYSALSAAAAVRAGISRLAEHPFMIDQAGDPMPAAMDRQTGSSFVRRPAIHRVSQ